MKVKSIFDRYMLTFLFAREEPAYDCANTATVSTLLEMLKADIKWPETYLLKQPDVAFAREALESLVDIAKRLRRDAEAGEKKKAEK
jgi:hypothetical protein